MFVWTKQGTGLVQGETTVALWPSSVRSLFILQYKLLVLLRKKTDRAQSIYCPIECLVFFFLSFFSFFFYYFVSHLFELNNEPVLFVQGETKAALLLPRRLPCPFFSVSWTRGVAHGASEAAIYCPADWRALLSFSTANRHCLCCLTRHQSNRFCIRCIAWLNWLGLTTSFPCALRF